MYLKFNKIDKEVKTPSRAHKLDAGLDCFTSKEIILKPHVNTLIPLGFSCEIPNGYVGLLLPKSSMNLKGVNTRIGVIDAGYTGEIKAVLINDTNEDITILKDKGVCQLVVLPIAIAEMDETISNERGNGGFGSTNR